MRGTRPLPLQIQVQAHVSAEGRGRTDTRVAPQQFLRLSRLPIPPLRPAFRSVKGASGSWLFCRFFPRYFAKSPAPLAHHCLTAVPYHSLTLACRALNHFTFCRHNAPLGCYCTIRWAPSIPLWSSHIYGAEAQNRTGDTAIFSRVLYQLSYLGNVKLAQKTLPQCAKTAIL